MSLDQSYIYQFQNNLQLSLQKQQSVLQSTIGMGTYQGEQASPVEYLLPITATEITSKNTPINYQDTDYERRWLQPRSFQVPVVEHFLDKIKSAMMSPTSQLSLAVVAAFQKKIDELIARSFYAPAFMGKLGESTKVFDTNNTVAVAVGASAPTTLNLEKLRKGKAILFNNNVRIGAEKVYLYAGIKEIQDLQRDCEANWGGQLTQAMFATMDTTGMATVEGINIVLDTSVDNIPIDGSGYRRLPLYTSAGMHWGYFGNGAVRMDISQDKTKEGWFDTWNLYGQMTGNATRVDENRVVEIKCLA